MKKTEDLLGKRFGRWTVIEKTRNNKNKLMWKCDCDCGNKGVLVDGTSLKNGTSLSCGCLKSEIRKSKATNLAGKKFGRWTVIKRVDKPVYLKNEGVYWLCKCDCGNEQIIASAGLTSGKRISCGCYSSEVTAERNRKNRKYEEGDGGSRLYNTWKHMHDRCEKDTKDSKDYRDRGIKVCADWNNFLNFKHWALNSGYSDSLTLDRIDVNGNYEPSNCRWADIYTQANNKTTNRRITILGETKTLAEWSRISGLDHKTIAYRIDHNWKEEEILSKPNELRSEKQRAYNKERKP